MMLRALLTIGGIQIIIMLVLLVRTKTLAVVLGPEFVGVMAVLDKLLAMIAQTVSLSLPFAAARFLPERWSAGPAEFRDLFTRMRNVLLALIVAATIGALLVSFFQPAIWGKALLPYRDVLAVAILGLPVIGLMPFLQNSIAGRLQQNRSMIVGLLHAVILAIAVVAIWWAGLAGYYAVYAVMGSILVVGITRMATAGTDVRPNPGPARRPFALSLPAAIWRFSGALLILTFLTPYAALFVHYLLLSEHGAETAGWMQAAIGISLSVRAVLGSAHAVFLTPNVNRGGGAADRMQWANRFQIMLCLIAGVVVPPLLLFPGLAIAILYSPAFSPGAVFVMVFVLTEVIGLLSGTYQSLLIALDHLRVHVAINLVAQIIVVLVACSLIPRSGILGAGLACLTAPVFLLFSTLISLHRLHGLRMPMRIAFRSAWLVLSLVATGFIGALFEGTVWTSLLVKVGAYAVVVGGFALLLTRDERNRGRVFLQGWRARWI